MATVKVQRAKGRNPQTNEKFYYVRAKSMGTKLRLYPFEKTRQEMKNFRFELIGFPYPSHGQVYKKKSRQRD